MSRRLLLTTDVVGGVWDFCLTLAGGLHALGEDVVLLALGSPTAAQGHAARAAGLPLISAPLKLEWMNDAAEDVQLTRDLVRRVAREIDADVVHANQFAAACSDPDVPVVLTLHSDILSWRRWTLGLSDVPVEWRSYTSLVREALSRADRVAAVSRFLATEVTELYEVHRPVEVIHNGWPVPHVEFGAREPSTLVAGRVWDAAKNITLVAEAAQGWQPGPVYLAGETGHPDGGQATIPPPLRAMGFLDRADLDTLLRRASLYLSAARYDPFGLLPLQAALHGCALLLSDIPSYREVWGDTATFFRSGDAADLRRQWRALLDHPPDARAREHARKHLSSERMVSDYRRLYSSVRSAVAA